MRSAFASRAAVWSLALLFACSSFAVAQVPARTLQSMPVDESDVIVILKDQQSMAPAARGARPSRSAAVSSAQGAIVSRLQTAHPRNIRSFSMINAFAARVSSAEAAQLASSPEVQAVVPDAVIRLPHRTRAVSEALKSAAPSISAAAADPNLCNTLEPEALQLTNTAFANVSTPQTQQLLDGQGKPVTGKGVKVAFIADGLDINNPGFIRPDGSKVFIDYQDFSGDPAGTPTGGGEAFGDASSIAAQDLHNGAPILFDISTYVSPSHPLPSPCNIRIRGVAPGASLVGLKVFSDYSTTTSNFIQAIEWAIYEDGVDVINESFGGNPYFDSANDPISLANHEAAAAGITVVVSTGDAGSAGTLGSPSTDPYVIAAGASTQFRLYAQTTYGAQALSTGYLSNNISAISSGGFAQKSPRTVDVVAPGDSGWALCSTNVDIYEDCYDFNNNPSAIEDFGGTSEAAPLTAGAAALVIQAYRSTHGGADPTPATVKKIIMSTATDLGAPADEQGAGLINTLEAVHAALSFEDDNGSPKTRGGGLVITPGTESVTSNPNTQHAESFVVTNTSALPRHLAARLQTLSPVGGANATLHLAPATDPTFPNVTGAARSYITHTFNVTAEAEHLDAEIAFKPYGSDGTALAVYLSLLDPSGKQAAYSLPQGFGSGYAHVDVSKPAAGKWTAIVFTRATGATAYTGAVHFTWSTQHFVRFGSVSPAALEIKPGATAVVQASFSMPSQPGDSAIALRLENTGETVQPSEPSVPLTLRTLVPLNAGKGDFSGTLTGGNGRSGVGPTQSYEFEVPDGAKGLNVSVDITESAELLEGVLVDPNGIQLSVQPSLDPITGKSLGLLQLFHEHPQAGRWHFVLVLNYTASGDTTSLPFQAHISLKDVPYTVTDMPDSPSTELSLKAKPVQVAITVKNTGNVRQEFFADARLRERQVIQLPQFLCSQYDLLPGACIYTYVPPEADKVHFLAQSTVPITMDALNSVGYGVGGTGSPDIFAHPIGTDTVEASLSVPEVPWGYWYILPSEIGPYGANGAPSVPVLTAVTVKMRPFDAAVTSDSGNAYTDLTFGTNTYNPLVLAPGATGVIHLTITPDPSQIGATVKGFLFIDTFNGNVSTGDEVARIPYSYTVVH